MIDGTNVKLLMAKIVARLAKLKQKRRKKTKHREHTASLRYIWIVKVVGLSKYLILWYHVYFNK